MTDEKVLEEIKPFLEACDKMIASKFIMIDKRISDVLKSIASSKLVFNLVKECMINFNFEREWGRATAKMGTLTPPDDIHLFVAFAFSLLNNFDNKKLNASEVLTKYYSRFDDNQGPYNQFCNTIIKRFEESVVICLTKKGDNRISRKEKEVNMNKEVLARLEFLTKDLKDYVQGLKKLRKSKLTKGELTEIINGLLACLDKGEVKFIKPFVFAIKSGYGKDKEIERRLVEIMDIVNRTLIDM